MASPHLITFSELDERPLLPCNRLIKLKMIFSITKGDLFERVVLVETSGHSDEPCGRPGFMTQIAHGCFIDSKQDFGLHPVSCWSPGQG